MTTPKHRRTFAERIAEKQAKLDVLDKERAVIEAEIVALRAKAAARGEKVE